MNRIDRKFRELKRQERRAFIAYIMAGDPTLKATERITLALERAGADIIELGIPFSDPLADGPTIQAAGERALKHGVNIKDVIGLVRGLRRKSEIPIVFMTYYNPVMRYGPNRFAADLKRGGVDGVIVPDLPFEEASDFIKGAKREGVRTIFLLAPTSTGERIKRITALSTGFVYYVSLTGVTGARKRLPPEVAANLKRIKKVTKKPVCVGFGVSNAGQARALAFLADGIIVGSAIVNVIAGRAGSRDMEEKVFSFAEKLAKAVHSV
jgi:tryptophan synthase alpha chain